MKIRLILLFSLSCTNVCADPRYDRSFEELSDQAAIVASGMVVELKGECRPETKCFGYEVTLEMARTFKNIDGRAVDSSIKACALWPLSVGRTYVVFIEHVEEESPYAEYCKYLIRNDASYAVRAGKYYREGAKEGAGLQKVDGVLYVTSAVLDPNFASKLESRFGK